MKKLNMSRVKELQTKSDTYIQENEMQVADTNRRMLIRLNVFYLVMLCVYGAIAQLQYEYLHVGGYYAAIIMFIFTWNTSLLLLVIEVLSFLLLSDIFKNTQDFLVDLFNCLLVVVLSIFCSYVLYSQRQTENEARKQLQEMGMTDKLTGLYNKASTELLCKTYLEEDGVGKNCAIMVLDIDNFKDVNDTFGHQQGDVVLQEFGRILMNAVGDKHIAGRNGVPILQQYRY